ncbi:DUF6152 family protein [Limnoraphis robusta Tam1]|nr:DUF6152 family protein [Limnoraphis robusta]MEA5500818.1 DUF6152 family protein [Limnoraphis robusta BA-68 BA1]MEA5538861.1 DUF6152 family protein [Limnoraphis robusta Tam1]MEA5547196.1 DUF6152 family protein [Limnoraphis robusta CCNP1324]
MQYRKLRPVIMTFLMGATLTTMITVVASPKGYAHHGWSEYNQQETLNVTGTIRSMGYENPHVVIEVETANNQVWRAVLAPPSRMQNRGLPQSDLKVGETVQLVGYPHGSESRELRAERIIIGEKTVELR